MNFKKCIKKNLLTLNIFFIFLHFLFSLTFLLYFIFFTFSLKFFRIKPKKKKKKKKNSTDIKNKKLMAILDKNGFISSFLILEN